MLADMADDEGWTVSYNHELKVLYRHHRSESSSCGHGRSLEVISHYAAR